MIRALVFIVGISTALLHGGQAQPSFAGRWRLADAVAPKDAAFELVITAKPNGPSVLRQFATGAKGLTALPARRASSLVMGKPTALDDRAGAISRYEEVWSIGSGDILIVQITDRPSIGVLRTVRLSYTRIPRPDATSLGKNLVENGNADQKSAHWLSLFGATVEDCDDNPCFTVRNGAQFQQHVPLPADAEGKFLVLIGSGASERVPTSGGPMTGLPYLYALVVTEDGTRFVAHLQLQELRARPTAAHEWVTMSGVFKLPAESHHLAFDLKQAEVKDVPQNGSAARFDDLGVYLFQTEAQARSFISNWKGRTR